MNFSIVNDIKRSDNLPKLTARLALEEKTEIDEIIQRIIGFIERGVAEATVQFSKLFDTLTLDDSDRLVDGITTLPEGWELLTQASIYRYSMGAKDDVDVGIELSLPAVGYAHVEIYPVNFDNRTRFGMRVGPREDQVYRAIVKKLIIVNDNPDINVVFTMEGLSIDLKNPHGNNNGIGLTHSDISRYCGNQGPYGYNQNHGYYRQYR